jgi:hypothetical protein
VLAIGAVFVDPSNAPWLANLLGEHMATKLAAAGAILSAFGRALFAPAPTTPTDGTGSP